MSGKASNTYAITYVPTTDVLTITWSDADFGSASFSGDHTSVTSDGMRSSFVIVADRVNAVTESIAFNNCTNIYNGTRTGFIADVVALLATRDTDTETHTHDTDTETHTHVAAELVRTSTQSFSSITWFDCNRVDYDPGSMAGSAGGSPAYTYFQVPVSGMYHVQLRTYVGSSSGVLAYLQKAADNTFSTSMLQRNVHHQTGYMVMNWLIYVPADYYVRGGVLKSGGSATTFGSSSVEHQRIGMSIAWAG